MTTRTTRTTDTARVTAPTTDRDILDARAVLLARAPSSSLRGVQLEALFFTLDDQRFGVSAGAVHEVARLGEVALFPDRPPAFLGIMSHHAELVPVVDVLALLGGARSDAPRARAIMLGSASIELALGASDIVQLRSFSIDALRPTTGSLAEEAGSIVLGTLEGALILDGFKILKDPRTTVAVGGRRRLRHEP